VDALEERRADGTADRSFSFRFDPARFAFVPVRPAAGRTRLEVFLQDYYGVLTGGVAPWEVRPHPRGIPALCELWCLLHGSRFEKEAATNYYVARRNEVFDRVAFERLSSPVERDAT